MFDAVNAPGATTRTSRQRNPIKQRLNRLVSLGLALVLGLSTAAGAASHREAPLMTLFNAQDISDVYAFRSYEAGREDFITILMNVNPVQAPLGGPNYFPLDPDALYEIHISNGSTITGETLDGLENLTFQFRFNNALTDGGFGITVDAGGVDQTIPLLQIPAVTAGQGGDATLAFRQTYTVTLMDGDRRKGQGAPITNAATGSDTFEKPMDNVGSKTIPDYDAYANQFIYDINIPGCAAAGRVFVGQRQEGFNIELGKIFDSINLDPLTTNQDIANATLRQFNITTIALELPISCVATESDTIGVWASTSLPQARVLDATPELFANSISGGAFVQISRMGNALVNELVIGADTKDLWNATEVKDEAQFLTFTTNPAFPELVEILFPGAPAPNNFPRNDLVATFLRGIPGLNQTNTNEVFEMLRLNTAIAPVARGAQHTLGVIGGDNAGYPNGRRPGDDVVDITLRVAHGLLCTIDGVNAAVGCAPEDAPAGTAPLTDGAPLADTQFFDAFPYLRTPNPGDQIFDLSSDPVAP